MNSVFTILIDGITYASWLFIVALGLTLVIRINEAFGTVEEDEIIDTIHSARRPYVAREQTAERWLKAVHQDRQFHTRSRRNLYRVAGCDRRKRFAVDFEFTKYAR